MDKQLSSIIKGILVGALTWFAFSSFTKPKVESAADKHPQIVASATTYTPTLELVKEEFHKIESKDDKILIYKFFAGSANYLDSVKTLTSTGQFDPILGRVQTSYGWSREKYPKFTDAVFNYLVSVKYDDPKSLSSPEEIKAFQKIFADLAEVTKNDM